MGKREFRRGAGGPSKVIVRWGHHRDLFDRLLVAQSQLQGMPILTDDAQIARYEVEVVW